VDCSNSEARQPLLRVTHQRFYDAETRRLTGRQQILPFCRKALCREMRWWFVVETCVTKEKISRERFRKKELKGCTVASQQSEEEISGSFLLKPITKDF